jgi:16S rRNA (guanine527-N7)-methyltransferase
VVPPGGLSPTKPPRLPEELLRSLERARTLGYLGPGPLGPQIDHASAFAKAAAGVGVAEPAAFLDLGSGGGLPGLVLAYVWGSARVLLLESSRRRATHLQDAVTEIGWADRVEVVCERAETVGRDPALRGMVDVVVARSFGRPAVTAECAAPFLRVGGILVVSEPPESESASQPDATSLEKTTPADPSRRWPTKGLEILGMQPVNATQSPAAYAFQVVRQMSECGERFPRRVGVPAKRPLFGARPPLSDRGVPRGTRTKVAQEQSPHSRGGGQARRPG